MRAIAEREHEGPFGQPVRVSRATLDRWLRDWRRGGFDALVPAPPKVSPRTPADVLELAVALKKEVPERTAVQIAAILRAHCGWSPDERTLQRHFVRLELETRPSGVPPQAFGRFEADAPNQRWTGDALWRTRHNASYADVVVMPIVLALGLVEGCRRSSEVGIVLRHG